MPTASAANSVTPSVQRMIAEQCEHRFGGERLHERDHYQTHTVFRAEHHHFHERGD